MDDDLGLTESDDALDDDCACAPGCDHEPTVGAAPDCDPACPVHGGGLG